MAGFVAKIISKKILGEKLENRFGKDDPYFEQVPATRLDGTPSGKFKKQRKALPPGISKHDGEVLTKVKRRAYRLDMSLCNCCGIRFGWSSMIGLVPAIGDILDAFMAMMVIHTCSQIEGGLPGNVKMRMYWNMLLDFGVGLVPFIGDVADAAFRANTRNAKILEDYLREKGKKNLRQSGQPLPAVDPSDPDEFDRLQREESPPNRVANQPAAHGVMRSGTGGGPTAPTPPAAARTKSQRSGGGFFGGRSRPHDVEMGMVATPEPGRGSGKVTKPQRR